MQTTLQSALQQLLQLIEQTTHVRAKALVRSGRFAGLTDGITTLAHALPANALDTLSVPTLATAAAGKIAELPGHLETSDLFIWPIKNSAGRTLAAFCFEPIELTDMQQSVLGSIGQTFAVLIESLDFAAVHNVRPLHDPLTHLPNRAMFVERLTQELGTAQQTGSRVGIFTIDLDNFSAINEAHGDAFGDRVLQRIASRLHHGVRRTDVLSRLSEDEFGLMALNMSEQTHSADMATQLLRVISQPMDIDGVTLTASASVGISVYPHDGHDIETLLQNSTIAMHRAKMRGMNQFEYFTPQMNAEAMERLDLESRMRMAIDKNQFVLHYQPVVDSSRRVTGVEALVRWRHPEQGMISPAKFIPVAEQTGMIVPLGTWVLRQAAKQAAEWSQQNRRVRMNVNVSTLQFARDDFVETVLSALAESQLDSTLLELELTESVFIIDPQEIGRKLARLREAGVRVAIDDFGAGYSSLSRLHSLPIDTLKIDRAFVNEITDTASPIPLHHRTAVLGAMATLGHSLGLRLVAEGVENETQAEFLEDVGYDAMQGYLFAKPMPAEQVQPLLGEIVVVPQKKQRLTKAA